MTKYPIKQALLDSVQPDGILPGKILVGANLTLIQGKNLGMASTLTEANVHNNFISESGKLHTLSISDLLDKFLSERIFESSLGMAALNSALEVPAGFELADVPIEIENRSRDKNEAVIGHFPFVDKLVKISQNCWVFEHKLQGGDLPAEKMSKYLPQADVLVLTAQVIANNYFHKIILGPSTPLTPVLFDYGIDVLGGVQVSDPELVYPYIA